MPDDLNGADYRACRRLSSGDDQTLADVGETCERVPASSLSWLLTEGLIEPLERPHHGHAALGALADELEGENHDGG